MMPSGFFRTVCTVSCIIRSLVQMKSIKAWILNATLSVCVFTYRIMERIVSSMGGFLTLRVALGSGFPDPRRVFWLGVSLGG